LYIRHPSKASVDSAYGALACPFAMVSNSGAIERQGALPLTGMNSMIDEAQQVTLLLAASDVSLLRLKLPPLSPARLKAALPNMVEDQIVSDPGECVVVAHTGPAGADGMRMVAVAERAWLEKLNKTLRDLGASKIVMLPTQLCLSQKGDTVSAAISDMSEAAEATIDLSLRLNADSAMGIPVLPELAHVETNIVETVRAIVPQGPIHLSVPASQLANYQALRADLTDGIEFHADQWSHWLSGAPKAGVDLMQGLVAGGAGNFDWGRWRWPLILLGLVLLVHIVALNYQWLKLRSEANTLRKSMTLAFTQVFPKEPLSSDLLAQIQKKISTGKIASGEPPPHDFSALAAGFGDAWSALGQGRKLASIAGLEYKDKVLVVRLKTDGEIPLQEMDKALATRNIAIKSTAPDTWEIRSTL
jgi:general secretion pathway protein L